MAVVPSVKKMIQQEEIKYKAAVSESTWTKIAGSLNFMNERVYLTKRFDLLGYYELGVGLTFADSIDIFEYDATIINAYLFIETKGGSGITELDIKVKPQTSGAWTSIFSTTPKASTSVVNDTWCGVGDTVTGFTAPVLNPAMVNVTAKSGIRCDIIQAMADAKSASLIINFIPR